MTDGNMVDLMACLWILDMPSNVTTIYSKIDAYDELEDAGLLPRQQFKGVKRDSIHMVEDYWLADWHE